MLPKNGCLILPACAAYETAIAVAYKCKECESESAIKIDNRHKQNPLHLRSPKPLQATLRSPSESDKV